MKIVFTLFCVASLALFLIIGARTQNAQIAKPQRQPQTQSQKPGGSIVTRQVSQDSLQITEATRVQLEALVQEKQSRTAVQQKIDSQLLVAARRKRNEALAPAMAQLQIDVAFCGDGRTEVDISGRITENQIGRA